MNKTKIEWTDYSWNPITGCTRGCKYCYARKMAIRLRGRAGYDRENPFQPTYHENRLNEPLETRKPSMIFTCSMGDFFGPEVPDLWRESIYDIMEKTPWHIYQILTKRKVIEPIHRNSFPRNMWVGVSIDGTSNYWKTPLIALLNSSATRKFISFEPILGNHIPDDLIGIDWAIIGAETGVGAKPPNETIVRNVVESLSEAHIPIFVKDNVRKHFIDLTDRWWVKKEEFPTRAKS